MMLMTTLLALLAIIALMSWAVRRAIRDGGPAPVPPPRHQDDWSNDLPTHPYNERLMI